MGVDTGWTMRRALVEEVHESQLPGENGTQPWGIPAQLFGGQLLWGCHQSSNKGNVFLLYNTGNCIQYLGITFNEEYEHEYIYLCA